MERAQTKTRNQPPLRLRSGYRSDAVGILLRNGKSKWELRSWSPVNGGSVRLPLCCFGHNSIARRDL